MTNMIEPLKWVRRKEHQDYVATLDGGVKPRDVYCIYGERNDWEVGVLGAGGHWEPLRHPETNMPTPSYHSLALAKLAAEVARICGVQELFEHVTHASTQLAGGGWGGWARSYIGKASCSCGWDAGNCEGVREARSVAADHVRGELEKVLRPEKVTTDA